MRQPHSKLQSELGNAVIEFIFVICFATSSLLILALQVQVQIRDHLAALSIAKETLRSFQLTESRASAIEAAENASAVFGLSPSATKVELQDLCSPRSLIVVQAEVREAVEVASATCQ